MTTRIVHRPARATRPPAPLPERVVEPPPNLPEGKVGGALHSLMPVAGVMSSVVMMTVVRNSQFAAIGALVLVVTVVGSVGLLLSQRGKAQRTRRRQRERYLEYLEGLREELVAEERAHRAAARLLDPDPAALHDLVRDPARLWERRRADPDFLRVRMGTGRMPVRTLVIGSAGGGVLTPPDPFMLNEAGALAHRFGTAADLPLTVPLDRAGNVSVVGERRDVLRVARALLVQTAAAHAPDDVAVALACPPDRLPDWEWLKWLPHVLDPDTRDGPVPARRIASGLPELGRLLGPGLRDRTAYAAEARRGLLSGADARNLLGRMLVVSDGHGTDATELPRPDEALSLGELGVTVLHLVGERVREPGEVALRITVTGDHVQVEDLRTPQAPAGAGSADRVSAAEAEGLARALAPVRLSAESVADAPLAGTVDFAGLLGLDDPAALDPHTLWRPRGERAFLRVPIGVDDAGEPVLLDLKESSEYGMGPHGLCVGATGSGKSELLRTLVLGLVSSHPPEDLALVLVDYKGGATFAPFAELPHVAGVITNLEHRAGLVERVHTSLAGEVRRRQQVLRDAGNLADIGHYRALRASRPGLEPMPHLFVIIDEFGELLTERPDFGDLFLSIGRIGRSIGIHLLLSSQRIESGKLKGLETYLSYRLGLRTFSAEESRTVLDTPDAFRLPPLPGFGYLKVDTSVYRRFKAGFVSGPYRGPAVRDADDTGPVVLPYPAVSAPEPPAATPGAPPERHRAPGPTPLSVLVDRLKDAAPPTRAVWLPPLPRAVTLDACAPLRTDGRGLRLDAGEGPMRVPLGLLDDPARQWQGRWVLDLTVSGGHAAVIGGPQSGKTTLLRSLVLSLALTHTPREVAVYGLDLAGGGLAPLAGLPHVGGVTGRADAERVARTVEEVRGMLDERADLFREHGIDSVEHLRELRSRGGLPELSSTEVVLVVDGFGALRDGVGGGFGGGFDALEDAVADILKRGGGYGVHVVASMLRWNDVRIATQAAFGTRVELRLNDPGDSGVDRKLAAALAPDEPGRVLTDGKLYAQTALPRVDALATTAGLAPAVGQAAAAIRAAWPGEGVRPVRVLPTRLPAADLPSPAEEPLRIPFGVDQAGLRPVSLDLFGHDQHLLVLGDGECGKTNLLRLVAQGLMARRSDEEIVFALMDPRRGLHALVPEPYRGGYATNSRVCEGLSSVVATELEKRMPDGSRPSGPVGRHPGPKIVVLVDDYDALAAAGQQPLAPFLPFVPAAGDIGLHFVVTRRVAGASRALYEPFLMALRESGATALVMTGDRQEGQLFPGVYAAPQPPGRGFLVRRGAAARLVQTALADGEPA
ncbi:type VII secretion protein EccCa [Streptomyces huiliensis]|uniref:type VII secretion protein EccCa n=1 Tax=Streptomyces huiliensis TaxID=2876027 RepID=UPI001CBF478B|nr:type VII secretion protein EccCa [Streptomyces huiliensis]MBZ4319704.1 type VII secretion protein EccCa [Streptomyces huiliensis]